MKKRRRLSDDNGGPVLEDWDFSVCPPDELQSCYTYEFLREWAWTRESVAQWRKKHPGQKFDDWLPTIQNPSDRDRPDYELYAFCPEWPDKPYLSILPKERRRRLELMPKLKCEHDRRYALRMVHLPAVLCWYSQPPPPGATRVFPPTERATVKEDDFHETICVTVDWRHHPKRIAKIFEELLIRMRPADIRYWKTKGKGRHQEQLRARLKALGAWRLLMKWKISWQEAEELTARTREHGQPLFDGQSHWLRACKQAGEFMDNPFTFGLAG